MKYALLVKHHDPRGAPRSHILAYDIAHPEEAERLARSLAASYPIHGAYADTGAHWFSDATGLHEILVKPVRGALAVRVRAAQREGDGADDQAHRPRRTRARSGVHGSDGHGHQAP